MTASGGPLQRSALVAGLVTLLGLGLSSGAKAGAQLEEPLADKVRSALAASVADSAPPRPSFASIEDRLAYLRWLGATSEKLKKRKSEHAVRVEFLEAVWYESKRAGLEPELVLGLIQVESGFRKYAISVAGARGYMQVMPFWARSIGTGDASRLFHMQTNLRFGCVILRHYLDIEKGDLFLALGRYNGSRGRGEYPNAVFANRRQWLGDGTLPAASAVASGAQQGT
ncbi:MAG: putative signal peptide protein [Proteobacteria bacterium]|jgi:soluble lytic murein transglycosylase-like protein|nr:putative signal peptide protein [Pseudomonadota bacterium]